jgi:hypothetical protein
VSAPQDIHEVLAGPHIKRLIGDQGFSFVEAEPLRFLSPAAAAAEAYMRRRRAEREADRG